MRPQACFHYTHTATHAKREREGERLRLPPWHPNKCEIKEHFHGVALQQQPSLVQQTKNPAAQSDSPKTRRKRDARTRAMCNGTPPIGKLPAAICNWARRRRIIHGGTMASSKCMCGTHTHMEMSQRCECMVDAPTAPHQLGLFRSRRRSGLMLRRCDATR